MPIYKASSLKKPLPHNPNLRGKGIVVRGKKLKKIDFHDLKVIFRLLKETAINAKKNINDLNTKDTSILANDDTTSLGMILDRYSRKIFNKEKDMTYSEGLAFLKEKCFGINRINMDFHDLKEMTGLLKEITKNANKQVKDLTTKDISVHANDDTTSLGMILDKYSKKEFNKEGNMSLAEALAQLKEKCFGINRINFYDLKEMTGLLNEIAKNANKQVKDLTTNDNPVLAKDGITSLRKIICRYSSKEFNKEKDMSLAEALVFLKEKCFGINRINIDFHDLKEMARLLNEIAIKCNKQVKDLITNDNPVLAKDGATSLYMIMHRYCKKEFNKEGNMSHTEALAFLKEKCFSIISTNIDFHDLKEMARLLNEIANKCNKQVKDLTTDNFPVLAKDGITSLRKIAFRYSKKEYNKEKDMSRAEALALLKEKCFGINRINFHDLKEMARLLDEIAKNANKQVKDLTTKDRSVLANNGITRLKVILHRYSKKEFNKEKDMSHTEALAFLKEKCFGINRINIDFHDLKETARLLNEIAKNANKQVKDLTTNDSSIPANDGVTSLYMIMHRYSKKEFNKDRDMSYAEVLAFLKEKCFGIPRYTNYTSAYIDKIIEDKTGIKGLVNTFSDRPDRLMEILKHMCDVPPDDLVQMARGYAELNLGEGQQGGNLFLTPLSRQRRKEGRIKKMGAIMDRLTERREYIKNPEFLKMILIEMTQKDYYESFNNENDFEYALKALDDEIAVRTGIRKEVLEAIRNKFVTSHDWETPSTINAALYLHQKEGAMFLVERKKALVSDEPRLGKTLQALAAAETLRLSGKAKKIVIVCPSPIKAVWSEQIEQHASGIKHLLHVVEGTQEQKRKIYEKFTKEGGYLVVNYENLRHIGIQEETLKNIDARSEEMGMREEEKPYAVAALKDADIAILDEVQAIDNPMAYQTQAIKEFLNPERIWALSATPYSNLPHKLFHLLQYLFPDDPEYSDMNHQAWKQKYAETADGLKLLYHKIQDISIRRKKDDIAARYPEEAEFDPNYREKYGLMLPNKVEVPYREAGGYEMNKEQCEIIRKIIFDFRSWAKEFNAGLPQGDERRIADIYKVNPFQKLLYIFYATLDPKLVGGKTDSPLYSELDKLVRVKVAKGEKILIFTEHTYFVDALLERYKDLGVARFDGITNEYMDVTSNQKAQQAQRQKFQNDPNVRIMVANTVSGGAGVTFSAAQNLIFLEKGWTYTKMLQAMDRPDSKDAAHMNPRYNIYTMVGTYPSEFVRSLPVSERRSFELSPRELLEVNLEGKKHLYHMVMDGYVSEDQMIAAIDKAITSRIFPSEMAFTTDNEKANVIASILQPISERWENEGLDVKPLNALGAAFIKYPVELLKDIVDQYVAGGFDASIMEAISLHMDQQHRELKMNMLIQTADLLESLKGKAVHLDLTGVSHKRSRLAALFATKGDPEALKLLGSIYKSLDGVADRKTKAKDDLFIGMSLLNGSYLNVTRTNPSIFESNPLSATELLFHLGILKNATGWLPSAEDMSSVTSLNAAIDEAYIQGFNKVLGTDAPMPAVRALFDKWGRFHQLFGIAAGLRSKDMKKEMHKLRETFEKITAGKFHDWRRTNGSVLYKDNDSKFWNTWLANHNMALSNISLELGISDRLRPMLDDMVPKIESVSKSFFNRQLVPVWADYLRSQDKAASMRKLSDNIAALRSEKGRLFRSNKPTKEIESAIKENEILLKFMTLHSILTDFSPTNEWEKAALKSIEDVDKIISPMIYSLLTLRASRQKALRNNLEVLHGIIRSVGRKVDCDTIEIFDTDDPKLILESGAFAPDMANCMHFLGDPQQNKALIDTLGGRNKKLVIVKVDGKIRSAATVKIRKDEQGLPVLFIEKPLHNEGYSFLEEMAWFLQKKASMMGEGTRVAIQMETDGQLRGKGKYVLNEEMVSNTGNYSQEYVEAKFEGDKSGNFRHTAILLTKKP